MSDGSGEFDRTTPGPETESGDQPPPDLPAAVRPRCPILVSAGIICAVWGVAGAACAWITGASYPNGYVSFAVVSTGWILVMLREGRKGTFRSRPDQETPEPEVVGAVYGAIFGFLGMVFMGIVSAVDGARVDFGMLAAIAIGLVLGPFGGAVLGAFCGNLWRKLVLARTCGSASPSTNQRVNELTK